MHRNNAYARGVSNISISPFHSHTTHSVGMTPLWLWVLGYESQTSLWGKRWISVCEEQNTPSTFTEFKYYGFRFDTLSHLQSKPLAYISLRMTLSTIQHINTAIETRASRFQKSIKSLIAKLSTVENLW